jgi:ribosomal protein S18 acetylase RimI-like enzyme
MVGTLVDELKRKGSPGVHLAMNAVNYRAYGFYQKLGFHQLARLCDTIYLGKLLD